ncbi:MAG: hypothetical protein JNL57_11075 [Bacteroidetes bacterium]|nr:hypothetical protein [Bacteroidota bacterium]
MQFFYHLGIYSYIALMSIVSLWNPKAREMLKGRRKWRKKVAEKLGEKKSKRIWFHCASLGEFEMAKPLIEKIKSEQNSIEIIITFFSPSGFLQRKDYECAGLFYLPFDSHKNAKDWYRIVQPDVAVFIKYEFWLQFMREGLKQSVHMVATGVVFREGQFIFEPLASAWRHCLQKFSAIFVQNAASENLGSSEGFTNIMVGGDTRFDRVLETVSQAPEIDIVARFKGSDILCVGGSTWAAEEKLLEEFFQKNGVPLHRKFLIAPHDVSGKHIEEICSRFFEYGCVKYSDIYAGTDLSKLRFLVVDSIGLLAQIYRYGDVALIGGAWGKGLHNILEAAAFGMPILFGPKHQKHPEAAEALDSGFALECTDFDSFERNLKNTMGNPELRAEMAGKSRDWVRRNSGVTSKVAAYLGLLLELES